MAGKGRRIAALPQAPVVACGLLSVLAAIQALATGRQVVAAFGGTYSGGAQIVLVAIGLLTTLPLGLMWPQPAVTALTIGAAAAASLTLFHTLTAAGMAALLVMMYRLGTQGSQRLAGLMIAGLVIAFGVIALANPGGTRVVTVLLAALVPAAAWAGTAWRARSEAAERKATREVIAGAWHEHTARGERARIARELHDVVAHHISMIAVQAETARLATPGMPAAGVQRLSSIGDLARGALTEMRRLLGVLREDPGAEPAGRQPQPGLRELNDLLDEARDAASSGTRLIVRGAITALDPGAELAAYRVIQEALTNSRRHAPGAATDVELHYTEGELRVLVRDNGPGPPADPPVAGHGLLGMRERVAAVGGRFRAGESASGGFLVEATLPAADAVPPAEAATARAEQPPAPAQAIADAKAAG